MNSIQTILNFEATITVTSDMLRDAAIKKAVDHANIISPGWSNDAYKILLEFISRIDVEFMTEDVREYAERVKKFTAPASSRAWGGPMAKAKRNNLIEPVGIRPVKNPKAHCANATIWRVKNKTQ